MLKRLGAWISGLLALLVPAVALAAHNPLHAYQERLATFINEVTVAGLFILPLVGGLAIVAVAVSRAVAKASSHGNLHDHDDRIKSIIGYLIIGESALALVAIISYFFKT